MLINNLDYRLGKHEDFSNLKNDLKELRKKISDDHPRITNFYKCLRDKNEYKKALFDAYKNRCCYCGDSLLKIDDVQMDHIVSPEDRIINDFENIAPSCGFCNRQKSDLVKTELFARKINPCSNIFNCFERKEDFSIAIRKKYVADRDVINFYNNLDLGNEVRRIDYIIVYLNDLCSVIINEKIREQIKSIKNDILEKRRNISLKSLTR